MSRRSEIIAESSEEIAPGSPRRSSRIAHAPKKPEIVEKPPAKPRTRRNSSDSEKAKNDARPSTPSRRTRRSSVDSINSDVAADEFQSGVATPPLKRRRNSISRAVSVEKEDSKTRTSPRTQRKDLKVNLIEKPNLEDIAETSFIGHEVAESPGKKKIEGQIEVEEKIEGSKLDKTEDSGKGEKEDSKLEKVEGSTLKKVEDSKLDKIEVSEKEKLEKSDVSTKTLQDVNKEINLIDLEITPNKDVLTEKPQDPQLPPQTEIEKLNTSKGSDSSDKENLQTEEKTSIRRQTDVFKPKNIDYTFEEPMEVDLTLATPRIIPQIEITQTTPEDSNLDFSPIPSPKPLQPPALNHTKKSPAKKISPIPFNLDTPPSEPARNKPLQDNDVIEILSDSESPVPRRKSSVMIIENEDNERKEDVAEDIKKCSRRSSSVMIVENEEESVQEKRSSVQKEESVEVQKEDNVNGDGEVSEEKVVENVSEKVDEKSSEDMKNDDEVKVDEKIIIEEEEQEDEDYQFAVPSDDSDSNATEAEKIEEVIELSESKITETKTITTNEEVAEVSKTEKVIIISEQIITRTSDVNTITTVEEEITEKTTVSEEIEVAPAGQIIISEESWLETPEKISGDQEKNIEQITTNPDESEQIPTEEEPMNETEEIEPVQKSTSSPKTPLLIDLSAENITNLENQDSNLETEDSNLEIQDSKRKRLNETSPSEQTTETLPKELIIKIETMPLDAPSTSSSSNKRIEVILKGPKKMKLMHGDSPAIIPVNLEQGKRVSVNLEVAEQNVEVPVEKEKIVKRIRPTTIIRDAACHSWYVEYNEDVNPSVTN